VSGKWAAVIPPELLDPEKKRDVLILIARLPVDNQTKKYILMDWCRITGVKLDEDMVHYVTSGRAEETRG